MTDIGVLVWEIDYVYVPVKITKELLQNLDAYPGKGHYGLGGTGEFFEHTEDATYFVLKWS